MCKCIYNIVFCLFCIQSLNGQSPLPTRTVDVQLGETKVYLRIWESSIPTKTAYAHVHENEEASLAAALEVSRIYGGKIVSLSHSPEGTAQRNVTFRYKQAVYYFDPNRIFTNNDDRLKSNIYVKSGANFISDEVVEIVRSLSDKLWDEVKEYSLIIALHNNRNAPAYVGRRWFRKDVLIEESYSTLSYIKRCDHSSESNQSCSDIYINPAMNNSEFFFVTKREDFDAITKKRCTVILQNENPIDDGSMSVYAAKNGKRYINAEAKQGRIAEQKEMLRLMNNAN